MHQGRVAVAVGLALALACSKSPGEATVLQPDDLKSNGAPFDAGAIVDPGSMQDSRALDAAGIQQFLHQTPYGGASFLATYASNGLSAAAAVALAAQRYALDPLVFLVRAQMDQGLIGAPDYPSHAPRVEYAFGCGCTAPEVCDPGYAGFDVQVDCLGAALRDALDAIAATGRTSGGWGPGLTSATSEGVQVTPRDDSTAALYQYTPLVAVEKGGGNWLFWNLWQKYAAAIGYAGPGDGGTGPTAWIGDACLGSSICQYEGTSGTCATQFPGGLCTLACTKSCPSRLAQAQTFCADFGQQGGYCLAACNPNVPQCRTGYTCESVKQYGDATTSQYVCFPK